MHHETDSKGRVERAIQYIRHAFYAARTWKDLDDLNAQAQAWCDGPAAARLCPEDRTLTVGEAFAQEQKMLLSLPDNPFPTAERVEVRVGKTPYVRFDLNDYSVPYTYTRCTLVVSATLDTVRILAGNQEIARHARTWDKGQQVEDPAHEQALVMYKQQARQARGLDRLHHAIPGLQDFLVIVAQRGGNLGGTTTGLLRLLDRHGAGAVQLAVAEALAAGTIHLAALHQILDRLRHAQGLPPPLPLSLPDDPRVRDLVVQPHPLHDYDALIRPERKTP